MSDVNTLYGESEIKNMLTIDITLGMARWSPDTDDWSHWWEYQDNTYKNGNSGVTSYGSLVAIENNTSIDVIKTEEL
ncbi:hypothetical protein ID852_02230 [Xenorhabdus sp. 42]|uniref:hypothetical protein n=1 Tax=Xenorhabdus szentirmaii TaxID=290112 RepID=UPI0019CE7726|nr:hypothetical protein [Xenorhabdus sp. 42]MBD2819533.1 hypothetical protein [Xenorhabdus sp. 42]